MENKKIWLSLLITQGALIRTKLDVKRTEGGGGREVGRKRVNIIPP
jgi:hypothetical protein